MFKKFTKIMMVSAMASIGFAALPANAGQSDAISLRIDRADLLSETGTQRIYYRFKQAAQNACQSADGRVSLKRNISAEACEARLLGSFVTQLNNRRMTAFHRAEKSRGG